MQRWRNIEISKPHAEVFKRWLKNNKVKYEASEADDLIHFECFVDEKQEMGANNFLDCLYRWYGKEVNSELD